MSLCACVSEEREDGEGTGVHGTLLTDIHRNRNVNCAKLEDNSGTVDLSVLFRQAPRHLSCNINLKYFLLVLVLVTVDMLGAKCCRIRLRQCRDSTCDSCVSGIRGFF